MTKAEANHANQSQIICASTFNELLVPDDMCPHDPNDGVVDSRPASLTIELQSSLKILQMESSHLLLKKENIPAPVSAMSQATELYS